MVDPELSLAFNIQQRPGAYALLLGSGISRAASLPTGWEVVLDLCRKLAALHGEDEPAQPASWYHKKFGKEPNYSDLVQGLAPEPAEQQALLSNYFEPTEDDRAEGLKIPTEAHNAIARLVAKKSIKVIITTNFDRLLESSLESYGVQPTVVSSSDAIAGMEPLAHCQCVVLKIHGDYKDLRVKNTETALSKYDDATNKLLDQVFDEYGLVISGWSGDWDIALRDAILRAPSRRYSTIWTAINDPSADAKTIITARSAQVVTVSSADEFFQSLEQKIETLNELNRPSPLSIGSAVAEVKKFCAAPAESHIRLHDLLVQDAKILSEEIRAIIKPTTESGFRADGNNITAITEKLESVTEKSIAIYSTASYFGGDHNIEIWADAFKLIAPPSSNNSWSGWKPERYPALLLLYATGVAAFKSSKFGVLKAILADLELKDFGREYEPAVKWLHPFGILADSVGKKLPGLANHKLPGSTRVESVLSPYFNRLIPDQDGWVTAFDEFELLLSLLHTDLALSDERFAYSGPFLGLFGYRSWTDRGSRPSRRKSLDDPSTYKPIRAGFFGGQPRRFEEARDRFLKWLDENPGLLW